MTQDGLPKAPPGYTRRMLIQDRLLVESLCDYCGFRIVGSIVEHLALDEHDHRAQCSKPGAKTAG